MMHFCSVCAMQEKSEHGAATWLSEEGYGLLWFKLWLIERVGSLHYNRVLGVSLLYIEL